MQEVIDLILHVQNTIEIYGKYQALFWVALVYLCFKRKKENQDVLRYSVVSLLLFWNPLFVYGIIHTFPEVAAYWQLLWVLPVEMVIAYGLTIALQETTAHQEGKKIYWGYLAAVVVIIALAGTIVPSESDTVQAADNRYGIPERDMEALQCLDQVEGPITLLAVNDVLKVSRKYNGSIVNVYGSSLWDPNVPNDTTDGYTAEMYRLYELMQTPVDHEEEITGLAADMGCGYLIISNGRREQEEAEVPRDPNQIVDLSVDVQKWCLNGYEALTETTYYHILRRK
ncbi:MAG: hypothetical protein PHE02_00355 [Lachnospiraceae bacterium]|nr:hypothetical protein [Lachnospiraceae bacterium]